MIVRILSAEGRPFQRAPITIQPEGGASGNILRATTDSQGLAQFDEIPPEVFSVGIQLANGAAMRSRVIARPDSFASQELTIRFQP
jgi:hypothetical protein